MENKKLTRLQFLITDSGIGGTEKVILSLLNGLDREKYQICGVLILKEKREMATKWEESGVSVQNFGMRRWPSPWLIRKVSTSINQAKPDIVHSFLFHAIQVGRLAHIFNPSFQLISSPRVNYQFAPKPALWLDRCLQNQDSLAICESEAGKRSLVKSQSYPQERIRVAWNSIDSERFHFDSNAREKIRREWNVSPDDVLIGSVGRMHHQKGYDVLIDAIKQMKGVRGPVKFVLVGSGKELESLKEAAQEASLAIRFVGERTDIPSVLSALDIYVQSSRYEGLSNALLEAMSVGCACVATAVDGTVDVSQDGENLLLARPEDPQSLALALATLVEKPQLRAQLSTNAKITAQTFSPKRMIQGFEEAYDYVRSIS